MGDTEGKWVGAKRATSKSKLLAREMPRVCSGGLWVDRRGGGRVRGQGRGRSKGLVCS